MALNRLVIHNVEASHTMKAWKGFRLYAIDGSRIRLPHSPQIINTFGTVGNDNKEQDCPMALASACYDVLNDVMVDTTIDHSTCSERTLAIQHLD